MDGTLSRSEIQAYVTGSRISGSGPITETATSSQTITALVAALSVALGAAAGVGVGALVLDPRTIAPEEIAEAGAAVADALRAK